MNFLVHMLISGNDDQLLTGNFMGDFVKGVLTGRFPARIEQGIILHRRIDSFAAENAAFKRSRQRIDARYGLYRGVMVDLFYDHLLVREWNCWADRPFADFLQWSRNAVSHYHDLLPERMQRLVPVIFNELLPSYGDSEGIATALVRMSRRVQRSNPLSGGEKELLRNYDGLLSDFRVFMPQVIRFAEEFQKSCIAPH